MKSKKKYRKKNNTRKKLPNNFWDYPNDKEPLCFPRYVGCTAPCNKCCRYGLSQRIEGKNGQLVLTEQGKKLCRDCIKKCPKKKPKAKRYMLIYNKPQPKSLKKKISNSLNKLKRIF